MAIVVDTSVIIAVVLEEPEKPALLSLTRNAHLLAPHSLHWEIGNAFSAMFKKMRLSLKQAHAAIKAYSEIPIQFCDIDLHRALEIAKGSDIYAYDAYLIECSLSYKAPLLTLDRTLIKEAEINKVGILEVTL